MYIHIYRSAYDRAAIKFRGVEADINFTLEDYEDDLKQVGIYQFNMSPNCFYLVVSIYNKCEIVIS